LGYASARDGGADRRKKKARLMQVEFDMKGERRV